MSALKAHAFLMRADRSVMDSIERLASGFRINRAADDAAGLAIANDLRAEIRGLIQAQRNAGHAVSILQIAEGALTQIEAVLVRMKELAIQRQSANTSAAGRQTIDAELDMLMEEIDRIALGTNYQGITLLDGTLLEDFLVDLVDGAGSYVSFSLADFSTATLFGGSLVPMVNDPDLGIVSLTGSEPIGTYAVNVTTTTVNVRSTSTTGDDVALITDPDTAPAGSYDIDVSTTTVRSAATDDPTDLTVVTDSLSSPAGSYDVSLTTTFFTTASGSNADLSVTNDPQDAPVGSYDVELFTTTTRADSTTTPDLTVTDDGFGTAAAGTYAIELDVINTRVADTDDPTDLTVTNDSGTSAVGSYDVRLQTTTMRDTNALGDLTLITDPDTAPAGTYDVTFDIGTDRTAGAVGDVAVIDDGLASGAVADTYDVHLETTRVRATSTTNPAELAITDDGYATAVADTYTVEIITSTSRLASVNDTAGPADMSLVTDSGTTPNGTYDVDVITTTMRDTTTTGDVGVVTDPDTVAAGSYDIEFQIGTDRTTGTAGDVAVIDDGLASGAVADTYDVYLDTTRVRQTSTDNPAELSITDDGYATAVADTYTVELITSDTRTAVIDDNVGGVGDLSLVSDNGTAADGTYSVVLETTTMRDTTTTGDVGVVTDPDTAAAGSYDIEFQIGTDRTTGTAGDVAVIDDGLASGAVADTYDVYLDTTRVRQTSTDNPAELSITDDGYATAVADTYTVELITSDTRTAVIDDNVGGVGDLSLVSDNGTAADGTYSVVLETTTMRDTTTTGDVGVVTDPDTAAAGSYDIEFQIGTNRSTSVTDPDLTVVDDGLASGAVADTYDVELITTTSRSTSTADGDVTVIDDGFGTAAAGTYDVALITDSVASTDTANLTIVSDPMTAAEGTYAVEITTTVNRSEYTTGSPSLSLVDDDAAPLGTYAVNITTAARTAFVTGGTVSDNNLNATGAMGGGHTFQVVDITNGITTNITINKGDTDATVLSKINAAFTASGAQMTATLSGGQLTFRHTGAAGSTSSFSISTAGAADPTILSTNYGISDGTYTGTNVAGTIGGLAATGSGTTLTSTAGAISGMQVTYSGTATGNVGNVVIEETYTYSATIDGEAATYDSLSGVISGNGGTSFAGYQVDYTLAAPTVAGTITVGNLVIDENIVGGTIGGEAATWDALSQTLTADAGTTAEGLIVEYTGPVVSGVVDSVTLTDTDAITGAQYRDSGGTVHAATWNGATGEITGNAGTDAEGLVVDYSGAVPGPTGTYVAGSVTLTDANEITGVTIDGEAAAVDDALNPTTITGGAGTFAGYELSYTGDISLLAQGANTVGTLDVAQWDEVTGGTIGGEAATWDNLAQTLTGDAGTTHDGTVLSYTGAVPGPTGTYVQGDLVIDTDTAITDAQYRDSGGNVHAATWNGVTGEITGDAGTDAEGLIVDYSGAVPGPDGTYAVGTVTLTDTDEVTDGYFVDSDANVHAATWDAVSGRLTGDAGTDADGLVVEWTGAVAPADPGGMVGSVTLTDANEITGVTIDGEAAMVDDALNPTTITGGAGTFAGYELSYTGDLSLLAQGANTVGTLDVAQWDEVTGGTIGGEAATWDNLAQTLTGDAGTTHDGTVLSYTGAVPGPTGTYVQGDLVIDTDTAITDAQYRDSGGNVHAATWNGVTGEITGDAGTDAEGLIVDYSGAVPGPDGTYAVGTVTLTDTDEVTDGYFVDSDANVHAATWDAVSGRLTGDAGTDADGLVVEWTGAVAPADPGGMVGSVTLTDANEITGVTIDGEAATVDDALNPTTITGGAGTFAGYELSYTGDLSLLAQGANTVGTLDVAQWDEITDATIGGEAATWDSVAQTITGDAGTTHDGMVIGYTGPAPGPTGTYTIGELDVNVTDSITDAQYRDSDGNVHAATWNGATGEITGDAGTDADGLIVDYSGAVPGPAGTYAVGDVTLTDTDDITGGYFIDSDANVHTATWDDGAQRLTGDAGTDADGLIVEYTGSPPPADPGGVVGSVTLSDANEVNAVYIDGELATVDDALNPTTITGGAGTFTGYELGYTGDLSLLAQGMNDVGDLDIDQWDEITGATIGGEAATWDGVAGTITGDAGTSHDNMELTYTGAVPGPTGDYSVGSLEVVGGTAINGGTIGGEAATWDNVAQTLTGDAGTTAEGLEVTFSGAMPPAGAGNYIGDVTLTDTTFISSATLNGEAATWDGVAGTITGDAATTLDGYEITYTGPVTSGVVGQVDVVGVTLITGGTIDGEAATWDNVAGELTGNVGTTHDGMVLSYTGAPMAGVVGTLDIVETTTITGVSLNGEAATWDPVGETITGDAGTTLDGYAVSYVGGVPGTTGTYTVGTVDVSVTPVTTLSSMTVGGAPTVVAGNQATVSAGPLTGTVLSYDGGPVAGYVGDFIVPDADAMLIPGIDAALESVWAGLGSIGAAQSRLAYIGDTVTTKIMAMKQAESTIRDLDYASEMTHLMKSAIVRNTALAMLAQANRSTSTILGLLGGEPQISRPASGSPAPVNMGPALRLAAQV